MKKLLRLLSVWLVVILAWPGSSSATDLIVNGGFEDGLNGWTSQSYLGGGGWQPGGAVIRSTGTFYPGYPNPPVGHWAEINAYTEVGVYQRRLSQTFALPPMGQYQLTVDFMLVSNGYNIMRYTANITGDGGLNVWLFDYLGDDPLFTLYSSGPQVKYYGSVGSTYDLSSLAGLSNLTLNFDVYVSGATAFGPLLMVDNVSIMDCCQGLRGNVNGDAEVSVSDLTYLVNFLFNGGPQPPCMEEGDVNGDTKIIVSDLTYLVNYLFKGGVAPIACS